MRKFIWSLMCMLLVFNINAQPEFDKAVKANQEYEKATIELVDKYKEISELTGFWATYFTWREVARKERDAKLSILFHEASVSGNKWDKVKARMYDAEIELEEKYPDKYQEYKKQKWVPKELPKDYDVKLPDKLIKKDDALHGMRKIVITEYQPGVYTWNGTFTRQGIENKFTAVWTGGNLKNKVVEEGLTIVKFVPKKEIEIKRKAGTYTGKYENGKWKGTADWYHDKTWYWTAEIHMNQ